MFDSESLEPLTRFQIFFFCLIAFSSSFFLGIAFELGNFFAGLLAVLITIIIYLIHRD
jgi:amino acid permease